MAKCCCGRQKHEHLRSCLVCVLTDKAIEIQKANLKASVDEVIGRSFISVAEDIKSGRS